MRGGKITRLDAHLWRRVRLAVRRLAESPVISKVGLGDVVHASRDLLRRQPRRPHPVGVLKPDHLADEAGAPLKRENPTGDERGKEFSASEPLLRPHHRDPLVEIDDFLRRAPERVAPVCLRAWRCDSEGGKIDMVRTVVADVEEGVLPLLGRILEWDLGEVCPRPLRDDGGPAVGELPGRRALLL